ncbi:MAG: hypothetical protein BMS9Abin05_2372 [Rhodothermia bacterium]|nr:MAG: hypothetical protein BMS9Abin05_2372 [Rhodothermia bacterium]
MIPGPVRGQDRTEHIVINELLAAPRAGIPEFVEILNVGPDAVDLSGLLIEDARRKPGKIISSEQAWINAGEFAVLTSDLSALELEFGAFRAWELRPWPSLNNSGDDILITLNGLAQDSVLYKSSWIEPGKSLERISPFAPASFRGNWATSSSIQGATPGLPNSLFVEDSVPPHILSVEYISTFRINLALSEPINPEGLRATQILLDGIAVSGFDLLAPFIDLGITVSAKHRLLSITGFSDFSGNELATQTIEIAQRAEPSDIAITEIMADPSSWADGTSLPEFIEFKNTADYPLSLAGLQLSIGPYLSPGKVISLRKRGVVLGVSEYAVIYSEPTPEWLLNPELMSSIMRYDDSRDPLLPFFRIPVSGSSLGLKKGSDALRIEDSAGGVIEEINYSDTWHDDRFLSTKGQSLERIRISVNAPTHLSWTTSNTVSGVSLGYSNAAAARFGPPAKAGDLRFNEIMYQPIANEDDGRPDQPEYIEIINTSESPLNLNGLYLINTHIERMSQDSLRLAFRDMPLEPDGLALAFTVPRHIPDGDESAFAFLSDAFQGADIRPSTILLPLRTPLSLSNNGTSLSLFSAANIQLDALTYSPEWHHFLVTDGAGSSLERVDPYGPSDWGSNWSTSVLASGGSPGNENSVAISKSAPSIGTPVSIEPKTFSPNFDGTKDTTRISVNLEQMQGAIRIRIFDLDGREVRLLVDTGLFTGTGDFYWDGSGDSALALASGIYIVLVEIANASSGKTSTYKAPVALLY